MRGWIICFIAGLLGLPLLLRVAAIDRSFVVWVFGQTTVEMPLWFVLFALVMLLIFAYFFVRVLRALLVAPRLMSGWLGRRGHHKQQSLGVRGFLALLEGHWTAASRDLQRAGDGAEKTGNVDSAAVNFLLAARARLENDDLSGTEFLLKKAEAVMPQAHVAIGIYRAQLLQQVELFDEAHALIIKLSAEKPRHALLQKMLLNSYRQRGDFKQALALLPALQKQKLLPVHLLEKTQSECCVQILQQTQDAQALTDVWAGFPASAQQDIPVVSAYCRALMRTGQETSAEILLIKTLNKQWFGALVVLYGQVQGADALQQLQTAERWLKNHPNDIDLLLALARLCQRNALFGKARDYFHARLQRAPDEAVAQELARLPALTTY